MKKNNSGKAIATVIIFIAIAAGAFFLGRYYWAGGTATSEPVASAPVAASSSERPPPTISNIDAGQQPSPQPPVDQPKPVDNKPADNKPADWDISAEQAAKMFTDGMAMYKSGAADKYVPARRALAIAMNSGKITPQQMQETMAALADLANKTIFSKVVYEGDPYTFLYTFKPGQVLQKVEREEKLHVPMEGILMVNGLAMGKDILAGQRVKMLYGPFCAVVYRSQCVMDIYLQDTFVRRIKVSVGAPESPTPTGYFRLTLSGVDGTGKLRNAPYNPPASFQGTRKKLMPGDPGYPLDSGGHWIGLTGIPEKGTNISSSEGYGIHGTNDPASIGKPASHGCIRLGDEDIKFVFSLLYEKWSTVTILP